MKVPAALVSLFAFAASVCAQTTWNVGPGGYAQIRDVMPLVQDDDIVVVAAGSYLPFVCTKAILLRAAVPGTVQVGMPFPGFGCGCTCEYNIAGYGHTRFQIDSGKAAHVVGVTFTGSYVPFTPCFTAFLHWVHAAGRVSFDMCSIRTLEASNADVHLQDCIVTSVWTAGIVANNSNITVLGGAVSGGLQAFSNVGTPAILQNGGFVHVCGATVAGAQPATTPTTVPGANGIVSTSGSLVLSDATIVAGAGCAVQAAGSVRIDRCTLTDVGSGCVASPAGAPLVGIDRNGKITPGAVFQVEVKSEPSALLILFGSTRLADGFLLSEIEQPCWLDVPRLFLADLRLADPTGTTMYQYPIPFVPQILHQQFWLQGVGGTSFPMQTTPVVGGIVR